MKLSLTREERCMVGKGSGKDNPNDQGRWWSWLPYEERMQVWDFLFREKVSKRWKCIKKRFLPSPISQPVPSFAHNWEHNSPLLVGFLHFNCLMLVGRIILFLLFLNTSESGTLEELEITQRSTRRSRSDGATQSKLLKVTHVSEPSHVPAYCKSCRRLLWAAFWPPTDFLATCH